MWLQQNPELEDKAHRHRSGGVCVFLDSLLLSSGPKPGASIRGKTSKDLPPLLVLKILLMDCPLKLFFPEPSTTALLISQALGKNQLVLPL